MIEDLIKYLKSFFELLTFNFIIKVLYLLNFCFFIEINKDFNYSNLIQVESIFIKLIHKNYSSMLN